MGQKAIIHTATRVIRRLTTETIPVVGADETSVDMPAPIDLTGGFWKLTPALQQVPANAAEIDAAGVDPVRQAQKVRQRYTEYVQVLDGLVADPTLNPRLRRLFELYRQIINE